MQDKHNLHVVIPLDEEDQITAMGCRSPRFWKLPKRSPIFTIFASILARKWST